MALVQWESGAQRHLRGIEPIHKRASAARDGLNQTRSIVLGASLGAVGGALGSALLYRVLGGQVTATQGYLSGLVTVGGAPLTGVGIVAVDPQGAAWTTTTNAAGYYQLNLFAGEYTIYGEAPGGALTELGRASISIGQSTVVSGGL